MRGLGRPRVSDLDDGIGIRKGGFKDRMLRYCWALWNIQVATPSGQLSWDSGHSPRHRNLVETKDCPISFSQDEHGGGIRSECLLGGRREI